MTTALIAAAVAVYVVQSALPARWEVALIVNFGFVPLRYVADPFTWPALVGPFSHQFLHGGLLHILLNMVMLAAFGAGVEQVLGRWRMLAFFLACGVAGAFAHFLIYPNSVAPVVGASGAISGLFGGVLRLMAGRGGVAGRQRILPAAVIWIGLAVVTGLTGLPGSGGAQIAWAAHVGGFLAGLALFDLFARRGR